MTRLQCKTNVSMNMKDFVVVGFINIVIVNVQLSSVQCKMVSMHSGRPICALPRLSGVSQCKCNICSVLICISLWLYCIICIFCFISGYFVLHCVVIDILYIRLNNCNNNNNSNENQCATNLGWAQGAYKHTKNTKHKMVKPYKCVQSQGHVKKKEASCWNTSTLIFCLCWPTETLHQGQGHRSEHEHISHA